LRCCRVRSTGRVAAQNQRWLCLRSARRSAPA